MVRFDYKETSTTLHCFLSGRLGADLCQSMAFDISHKIKDIASKSSRQNEMRVVFDLNEVDYIASGFIRICMDTAKTIDAKNFSIVNTHPLIKKTFKIAGLDQILNVS